MQVSLWFDWRTVTILFSTFPRTQTPPHFVEKVIERFRKHEQRISPTTPEDDNLESDEVLSILRPDLIDLGFDVEASKKHKDQIMRPVFFGQNAKPELQYQIDAWHPEWSTGLEIEAGRGLQGNAIYRDIVQALVMVDLEHLVLAVRQRYYYKTGSSKDYEKTVAVAQALYAHSRVKMPFTLCVVGY